MQAVIRRNDKDLIVSPTHAHLNTAMIATIGWNIPSAPTVAWKCHEHLICMMRQQIADVAKRVYGKRRADMTTTLTVQVPTALVAMSFLLALENIPLAIVALLMDRRQPYGVAVVGTVIKEESDRKTVMAEIERQYKAVQTLAQFVRPT